MLKGVLHLRKMSSSSRSSRVCSQKPDLPIRPATDPLWTEEGFDAHEFRHVATWESPLRYKGAYQAILGIPAIPGLFDDNLKLNHEVKILINLNSKISEMDSSINYIILLLKLFYLEIGLCCLGPRSTGSKRGCFFHCSIWGRRYHSQAETI